MIRATQIKLVFVFLCIIALTEFTQAGPLGYKEGRWVFKAKESYFSSNENWDKDGNSSTLPNGQSLTVLSSSLSVTHDITDSISAFAILDAVYGKSVGFDFERTRFFPTDLKLGSDILVYSGFVDLVPELIVNIPIDTIAEDTDEVVLSEGVFDIRAGTYISQHFNFLSGYAYIGYAYRAEGRSSLIPYEVQLVKAFGDFQLNAGLWGHQSLQDDEFTDLPQRRRALTSRVNGGSLRFYSVNPSVMELGVSGGLPVSDSFFARVGFSRTLLGSETAIGNTFWASLSYSFGGSNKRIRSFQEREKQKIRELKQQEKQQNFVPESYEETTAFEEAVKTIQKEPTPTPKAQPAPAAPAIKPTQPNTKKTVTKKTSRPKDPPMDVKLRKKSTKKKNK